MLLIELALHNILGLKQLIRLKLKPGLNLVQGNNGAGKTTIQRSVIALLSTPSDTQSFSEGQAGMILRAADGQIYRLVRDFSKQKASLARRDAEGRFHPLALTENQILQFILEDTRGLRAADLETVFVMNRSSMPSVRTSSRRRPGHPAPAATAQAASPPAPLIDREKAQARIDEIQGLLDQADQASNLEDQAGELRIQTTDLQRKLKVSQEKSISLRELDTKEKPLNHLWPISSDDQRVLDQYTEQLAVREDQIRTLDEDRSRIEATTDAIPAQPLYMTPLFVSGAGVLAVSFIVPQFIMIEGLAREFFFLPLLVGVGLMAWAAIRDFQQLSQRKMLNARLQNLTKQQESIDMDFQKDTARARELLEKAACADMESFKRKSAERDHLESLKKEMAAEIESILQGNTPQRIEEELRNVETQLQATEEKARLLSGIASDVYMLQEEMRRLQEELAPSGQTEEAAPDSVFGADAPEDRAEAEPGESFLPEALRELLLKDPIGARLQSKIPPLNTAIRHWFGRFPRTQSIRITLNDDLTVSLFTNEGASLVPNSLGAGLLDCAYFVCHVALAGVVSVAHPFPLLLDDPFLSLDAGNQQIALDILREIAQNKQVLLMASLTHPGKEGEGVIALPRP
jgi:energy-coupling factor transporter ATP-binding protein EcfA2